VLPITATAVLDDVQDTPPLVASLRVVTEPTQTEVLPVIAAAEELTDTTFVLKQPELNA
jgi:hypothetical protein